MERKIEEHAVVEQIPWTETCFGCNGGSNEGIGMRAYITDDGCVVGLCRTKEGHQGFPGTVHGGLIAAYFDEVLWHATRLEERDRIAMTVEIRVKYLRPVGTGLDVRIVAKPARTEGRHIYVDGFLLLPDDQVAAEAFVHYISVRRTNDLNRTEPGRLKHPQTAGPDKVRF